MMIRVSGAFLDFNELVEMERQIKLIEEISATDGDFSYSFDLAKTDRNSYLLGNPQPDNLNKRVYQRIDADLLSDGGAEVAKGYLRIEGISERFYQCSFFAGNNNWFSMISGNLSELNFSEYDVKHTEETIRASRFNTDGVVFPLVDNGPLLMRRTKDLKIEDLVPAMYVKTIFRKIFESAGIKLEGDLFKDWRFNNMVCQKIGKDQSAIDIRSAFIQKNTIQNISNPGLTTVYETIEWDNDSVAPYFNGSNGNWDLGTLKYTADVKMVLEISMASKITDFEVGIASVVAFVNGVELPSQFKIVKPTSGSKQELTGSTRIYLNEGDEVEVKVKYSEVIADDFDILSGTIKFTPVFLYETAGSAAVPNWSKQDFVSNILRLFNCLPSFDADTRTLTINLFNKIKDRTPIDLSQYISETTVDYTEFVSNYGKKSKLSYNEVEFKELKEYNIGRTLKYGQGYLTVNNDFIEEEADILESEFSNPIAYVHPVLNMSMERMNLLELSEAYSVNFTGVSDNSGVARFAVEEDSFFVGDLVRISDSIVYDYNGDWVVSAVGSGWVEFQDLAYDADADGKLSRLQYDYASDDVYLLIHIPDYDVNKFSALDSLRFEGSEITDISLGYFDVIDTGQEITQEYKKSLSFGGIESELRYQSTMTQDYFRVVEQVLNDPVKLFSTAHLPHYVYKNLTFLDPVTIKTMETTNRYYLNRITGYKESYLPCTLELIKLP
jgi:hypothetical protein